MRRDPTRRQMLSRAGAAVAAAAWVGTWEEPVSADSNPAAGLATRSARTAAEPFGYCLNTSTIRGQNLPLEKELEIAAQAGFRAVEPWINEIEAHQKQGGSLDDLRKKIADLGLSIESAIGFAEWIVDDDEKRKAGLEHARRDMDLVARIGGKRMAAPPVGAQEAKHVRPELPKIAERYRGLLDLGRQAGVIPELELWGFSKTLSRLGEVAYVAVEAAHPDACILLDIYHLYKGGSDPKGLKILNGRVLPVLHVNDYPANPPRAQIADHYRVYPGDGVAPLDAIFRDLRDIGFRGFLSVELFNKDYWKQSPAEVARIALEKTRAAVHKALG